MVHESGELGLDLGGCDPHEFGVTVPREDIDNLEEAYVENRVNEHQYSKLEMHCMENYHRGKSEAIKHFLRYCLKVSDERMMELDDLAQDKFKEGD